MILWIIVGVCLVCAFVLGLVFVVGWCLLVSHFARELRERKILLDARERERGRTV
jgi:predicted negative regulator of RcsB-dependent stress response